MPRKKLPYKEGDWFAVPLRTTGYGIGIVARLNGEGTILAYFFDRVFKEVPNMEEIADIAKKDVVWIRLVGDLGLIHGEWHIIGYREGWDPSEWPLPSFGRVATDGSWATVIHYSETDLSSWVSENEIDINEARELPEEGLSGHKAAEVRLTKVLGNRSRG